MRGIFDMSRKFLAIIITAVLFAACVFGIMAVAEEADEGPVRIVIRVDNQKKLKGEADPVFTGRIVEGELKDEMDLGTLFYYRMNSTQNEVGKYTGVIFVSYAGNDDYEVVIEKGDFEILDPAKIKYTVNFCLNGTDEQILEPVNGEGQYGSDVSAQPAVIEGYTLVPDTVISGNAGEQKITLGIEESENVINFYYYKNVTVSGVNSEATYDGSLHSAEGYIVTDSDDNEIADIIFKNPDNPSSDLAVRVEEINAGIYTLTVPTALVGCADSSGRYIAVAVSDGELVINRRQISPDFFAFEGILYDGEPHILVPDVKTVEGQSLASGKDFTVKYFTDNGGSLSEIDPDDPADADKFTEPGTVTVEITGVGNYTGTFETSYTILEPPATEAPATEAPVTEAPATGDGAQLAACAIVLLVAAFGIAVCREIKRGRN